jgi:class 3 adenylate cyclase
MAADDIPGDVERLLFEALESYEQLEALLLLVEEPHLRRGADDVAAKLGMPEEAAREALDHLRERGLAVASATGDRVLYGYGAPSPDRDAAIRALARIYRERPAEIAKRMTANAIERLRTSAIRTFSDAFLLRGSKKDDG